MSQTQPNIRLKAVRLLADVLPKQASLAEGKSLRTGLIAADTSILAAADRGLFLDLLFGVCRHWRLLNHWLDQHTKKRLKPSAHVVRIALCCGLYELWFTDRPAHAIVNAWPDVCRRLKKNWATGLVNALLRKASRTDIAAWQQQQPTAIRYSLPDWLYDQWQQDWPDDAPCIAKESNLHAPFTLHNNSLQQSRQDLLDALNTAGLDARAGTQGNNAVYLQRPVPVSQLPGFSQGSCSVQDEAAQLPASLFDFGTEKGKGQRLLDACAAPGGKLIQLCQYWPDADISAIEIDSSRLMQLEDNLSRMGLAAKLHTADATQANSWWDNTPFDGILLDAPCSATGIIRRQPDAKWHRKPNDIEQLVSLQAKLLKTLWPLLKLGGTLVYATCSISLAEGRQQIEQFLQANADASDDTPSFSQAKNNGAGCYFLPRHDGWDGFYLARLKKAD